MKHQYQVAYRTAGGQTAYLNDVEAHSHRQAYAIGQRKISNLGAKVILYTQRRRVTRGELKI